MDKVLFLLCAEIFACRLADVSLATVRTVFTVRGKAHFAAICGFFEVFIWFIMVREALNQIDGGIYVALAYAGGFAVGTLLGGYLSKVLVQGKAEVQIVTPTRDDSFINKIREAGFGASVVDIKSSYSGTEKYLIFIELDSRRLRELKNMVKELSPRAFMTVHDTNYSVNGFFAKRK
ncbi:MAG: DUF2179 domain-containing protein [Firmicutes bacterium]|nr:DUF2179 domain-containing protein [Bacillota bacterium]